MSVLSKEQQQQWVEHIQAWRESGVSQQAYCQQQGLKPHQFWYWKHKLSQSDTTEPTECAGETQKSRFVPVTINQPVYPDEGLALTFPGGTRLTGITSHNLLLARQLVEGLK